MKERNGDSTCLNNIPETASHSYSEPIPSSSHLDSTKGTYSSISPNIVSSSDCDRNNSNFEIGTFSSQVFNQISVDPLAKGTVIADLFLTSFPGTYANSKADILNCINLTESESQLLFQEHSSDPDDPIISIPVSNVISENSEFGIKKRKIEIDESILSNEKLISQPTSALRVYHVHNKPHQPHLQSYKIDKYNRHFRNEWYQQYTWLEYSTDNDCAYCFPCRKSKVRLMAKEMRHSYQKVLRRGVKRCLVAAVLKVHSVSAFHLQAMTKWVEYDKRSDKNIEIHTIINNHHKHQIELNRYYASVIVKVINFCTCQGLALRGHDESKESVNSGNFLQLYDLIKQHDEKLKQAEKNVPNNANYMSSLIQNQFISIQANQVIT